MLSNLKSKAYQLQSQRLHNTQSCWARLQLHIIEQARLKKKKKKNNFDISLPEG